jgi:hypothetical protein
MRHLEGAGEQAGEGTATTAAIELAMRREINALQRHTLEELREQVRIGITTLRSLQRELDLQETAMASGPAPLQAGGAAA